MNQTCFATEDGASGYPMATLVSIEEDTSLLALEARHQRLKQTVAEREKKHQEWVDLLREARETLELVNPPPEPGWLLIEGVGVEQWKKRALESA